MEIDYKMRLILKIQNNFEMTIEIVLIICFLTLVTSQGKKF